MRKYYHVILFVLILLLVYFSWTRIRIKPLDKEPIKAKLVKNISIIVYLESLLFYRIKISFKD